MKNYNANWDLSNVYGLTNAVVDEIIRFRDARTKTEANIKKVENSYIQGQIDLDELMDRLNEANAIMQDNKTISEGLILPAFNSPMYRN